MALGSRSDIRPPMRPGWYPDGEGRLRYFDGRTWTDSLRQRPRFANFVAEVPASEVSFRQPLHRRRRIVKFASLVVVALLIGGIVAQLVIFGILGSSSPKIQNLASYRRAANGVCASVFDGVSVTELEKNTGGLLGTKLSQSASAFGVLASETATVPGVNTVAARWSNLAIAWSRYLRDHRTHSSSVLSAMRALEHSVVGMGVKDCAVFTPAVQQAMLS